MIGSVIEAEEHELHQGSQFRSLWVEENHCIIAPVESFSRYRRADYRVYLVHHPDFELLTIDEVVPRCSHELRRIPAAIHT